MLPQNRRFANLWEIRSQSAQSIEQSSGSKDHKIIRVNKARIKKSTGGTKTNTGRFNLLKRRIYRTLSSLSWSDSRENPKESTVIDKFSKSDDKKVCRQHDKADTINKHKNTRTFIPKNKRKISKREQARRER